MMKKNLILFSILFFSTNLFAENNASLSDKINSFFEPIVTLLAKVIFWDPVAAVGIDLGSDIPIVVVWLVFGALFLLLKWVLLISKVLSMQ